MANKHIIVGLINTSPGKCGVCAGSMFRLDPFISATRADPERLMPGGGGGVSGSFAKQQHSRRETASGGFPPSHNKNVHFKRYPENISVHGNNGINISGLRL